MMLEDIQKAIPKHSYNLGASLLACGGSGFSVDLDEMSSTKWYLVKLHRQDDFLTDSTCTCYAAHNERKCKHVACLLSTVHSLNQDSTTTPKLFP
jgi:hypothetical protein